MQTKPSPRPLGEYHQHLRDPRYVPVPGTVVVGQRAFPTPIVDGRAVAFLHVRQLQRRNGPVHHGNHAARGESFSGFPRTFVGEREARSIALQLCAGLAEAHRNQVIHGDLKSNNVILTSGPNGAIRAVSPISV